MSCDGVFGSISCISDEMTSEGGLLAPKNRAIPTTRPKNTKMPRTICLIESNPSVRPNRDFDKQRRSTMVPGAEAKPKQSDAAELLQ